MVAMPTRRLFTVDEYYCMLNAGILHEDDRVELLEGEIIQMAAIGSRHAARVNTLAATLIMRLGDRAIVRNQSPVHLSSLSEPEPDISIALPRRDRYADSHPTPAEVLLIVEVSDTTLVYDRDVKVPLYARAGIPEVWIDDLGGRRLLVYQRPSADGYQDVTVVGGADTLSPEAFPDLVLSVADSFPTARR